MAAAMAAAVELLRNWQGWFAYAIVSISEGVRSVRSQ
jgi:hypothetical protein